MKLPWQKSDDPQLSDTKDAGTRSNAVSAETASGSTDRKLPKGYTPPKGRPTPTRREQEIERGVIRDPNALTPAQAMQKRKELKKSMTKQEWKEYKAKERAENRERNRIYQQRLAAGEEKYLPESDRGPERAFARDWVDSKRWISEWMMPVAFALLFVMVVGTFAPAVASISSVVGMVIIVYFFAEGLLIGSRCNRAVSAAFPGTTATGFGLGFYAFSRAMQMRRWRTPRPRVEVGQIVEAR